MVAVLAAGTAADPGEVPERDRVMLRFAATRMPPGLREQRIRERFGLSAVAFFVYLNRLIDTAAALAAEPVAVNRLRRMRDAAGMWRGWLR
jgi:hypothetical protein